MGDLRDAFDQTIDESSLIEEVDAALVAAGRTIADRVDDAVANCEGQELTKALYLMPHLVNILRELLATPAARKDMPSKGGSVGKLALLQAQAKKPAPARRKRTA